jgi:hypothetical protein
MVIYRCLVLVVNVAQRTLQPLAGRTRRGKRNPNLRTEVLRRHALRVVQDELAHTRQHQVLRCTCGGSHRTESETDTGANAKPAQ